jgi:hypothetical protein
MKCQSQWMVLNGASLWNILHVVLYQNFEFKFAILCYEKATHPKTTCNLKSSIINILWANIVNSCKFVWVEKNSQRTNYCYCRKLFLLA